MKIPRWFTPTVASVLALIAVVSEFNRDYASSPSLPVPVIPEPLAVPSPPHLAAHPDVLVVPRIFAAGLPTRRVILLPNSVPLNVVAPTVVAQAKPRAESRAAARVAPRTARTLGGGSPRVATRNAQRSGANTAKPKIAYRSRGGVTTAHKRLPASKAKRLAAIPKLAPIESTVITEFDTRSMSAVSKRPTLKQKLGRLWGSVKSKFRRKGEVS